MSETPDGMSFEDAIATLHARSAAKQAAAPQGGTETASEGSASPGQSEQPVPAAAASQEPERAPAEAPAAPVAEAKPQESAPVDPSIKRLLDREAQLQEREKALATFEAAKRQFKHDPVKAIKAIYPDASLSEIAKALWVEELGDLAPPEARQEREVRGVRSEVEELRAQVEEERRRLAEETSRQQGELAYNQYAGAIRAAVSAVDAGKYPLVAGFHKKHSDGVVDEMLAIARNHAQASGEVLEPAQVLAVLEGHLGRYQINGPAPAAAAPSTEAKAAVSSTTLRNSHSQVQPNLTPPDDLNDEYLREQALKAVREARIRRQQG